MKKALSYIKEHIITGVAVVLPIVIVIVILAGTFHKLIEMTMPITDNMHIAGPLIRTVIVTIIILFALGIFFFISGVFFNSYFGTMFKKWLEKKLIKHIPFFNTINNVVHQLTGVDKEKKYEAVEVDLYGNNTWMLGIRADTLNDGRFVVYIPFGPIFNIGQVYFVDKKNVKTLDITLKEFMDVISKIGFEAKDVILNKKIKS